MANNHFIPLFSVNLFLLLLQVNCKNALTPALYVFGDSLSDSGNNNFLQTNAKVNYKPYGVDFPSGIPTGRFTNGKTFVDYVAQFLGLPFVPAYLGLSTYNKTHITTGINYASGAAGILPESGSATGDILTLDEQIDYFKSTVENDLPKNFQTQAELSSYLSKSIFSVKIGNNDYINNYLKPAEYNSSRLYTPQQFADRLVDSLQKQITRLYNLGARKFVVFNVARLGCIPGVLETLNPLPTSTCAEDINQMVLLYNTKLPSMITTLESNLLGSTFVTGDLYTMGSSSAAAGFFIRQTPCCKSRDAATGLCRQGSSPCLLRSLSLFWDAYHPTETVNVAQATECFFGFITCNPINILQLTLRNNNIESSVSSI
ncbi:hypothetical protein ACHQM5_006755 [Ranunculus cassubicifolius]